MSRLPELVAEFLSGSRIAVAGGSRDRKQAANAVYRKLRDCGYVVIPVNPNASEVEGTTCYPDVLSIPESLDAVVIATHPDVSLEVVRQCAERGVERVWFHHSFGSGSVSQAAVDECAARGIQSIVGGCPLMFCEPVDFGHRCMRWWLQRKGRAPR